MTQAYQQALADRMLDGGTAKTEGNRLALGRSIQPSLKQLLYIPVEGRTVVQKETEFCEASLLCDSSS